jgi:ABC-type transport system involved in multi-copper enzyme maturation permease subunit
LRLAGWGLLALAVVWLLRGGLFGPVVVQDAIRTARRGRLVLLRTLYGSLLLLVLLLEEAAAERRYWSPGRFAEEFFLGFLVVQLWAVVLLTPAWFAGAIADERHRKRLDFLLTTHLSSADIVLGKLTARLGYLALFLLTALPILAIMQFLGGIDPDLLLYGFAVTGLTALSLGALSILNSTLFAQPRDAIGATYIEVILYLILSALAPRWLPDLRLDAWLPRWAAELAEDDVRGFSLGNPFLLLAELNRAAASTGPVTGMVELLRGYALHHGVTAAVCVGWAVLRLRSVAERERQGRVRGVMARERPRVGDDPVLWKEVHVEGGPRLRWGCLLLAGLVVGSFVPAAVILLADRGALDGFIAESLQWRMNLWVRIVGTLVATLGLLAIAVRAAGSVVGERERGTLDGLLTTPLSTAAILRGKLLGSILSARWTWPWLAGIWGLGVATGGLNPLAVLLLAVVWAGYAFALASLGLSYSVSNRTTLRATVQTLVQILLLGFACLFWPPMTLAVFAFHGSELENARATMRAPSEALHIGVMYLASWAGWVLLGAFTWRWTKTRFREIARTGADPTEAPAKTGAQRAPMRHWR